jgi:3' terminal RNA ribose 2'-O-methyltransferase Hen1
MLLTISTTHRPATDLGYLLHKSPERVFEAELPFGTARVFYTKASEDRCTAALNIDVDPIGLVRKPKNSSDSGPLVAYVNDRPYAASSLLATALTKVFGTAMAGRSKERQALADKALPLEVAIPAMPCRGGESLLRGLFEPLGYAVAAEPIALDPAFAAWGDSRYFSVTLTGTVRLADFLSHLYVLVPVLDDDKHYWVGTDEVEKLVRKGAGWLEAHPLKAVIVGRALRRRQRLIRSALEQLTDPDGVAEVEEAETTAEEELERAMSLNEERLGAVTAVIRASGARRVLDLGCGEGNLLKRLLNQPDVERVLGMDVSFRSVESAKEAILRLPARFQNIAEVVQGSLLYRDDRLKGWDAAALVEVIEHVEPERLRWLEHAVFAHARPTTVVVTTPNVEYNARFVGLETGHRRHPDHRFEWTRAEFQSWCAGVGEAHRYQVRYLPIGPENPEVGPPTQMAVFELWN